MEGRSVVLCMIRSMTGYGRAQQLVEGYDITVELRSVNHRYFEFSTRLPRAYGYLEEKLKSFVNRRVSRGKVDIYVGIVPLESTDTQVQVNRSLARSYLEELQGLAEELEIRDDIGVSRLAGFSDIFVLRKATEDQDFIWDAVGQVAEEALDQFVSMREVEGEKLQEDILSRLDLLEKDTGAVEERSPGIVSGYRDRLYAKIKELLDDRQIDEQRILTEAAIFAEKIAVDEETVRLRSHIGQLHSILAEGGAVGRKLDFLVQELNREVNTIGSKSQDTQVARLVVEMKSEIEKIREQVQNLE